MIQKPLATAPVISYGDEQTVFGWDEEMGTLREMFPVNIMLNQDLQDFEDYRVRLRFKHKGHL